MHTLEVLAVEPSGLSSRALPTNKYTCMQAQTSLNKIQFDKDAKDKQDLRSRVQVCVCVREREAESVRESETESE